MQNQKEIQKINRFLCMVSAVVTEIVKTILQSLDYEVNQKGHGLDLVFTIKKGEKQAEFYLQNLLLEIATIDRDENPMRFDEKLRDFDYFLTKTCHLVESKLNVLFHLFGEEDVDAAIENIAKDAKQYERIRIWRFDQREPDRKC